MNEIVIKNEKDAFDLLQKALDHQLGDQIFSIKFDHWPLIQIKLEGEGYDSTITPDMAGALVRIQEAINRTYARTVHQSVDARGLTLEERKDLQFKAKVESGSSLITVDLGKFSEKLATGMVNKMNPELLTITIIGAAIVGASLLAYKWFLNSRSKDKVIDKTAQTQIALSQEETKRMNMIVRALAQAPELTQVQSEFDDARSEIVRATGNATKLTVNSIELDNATTKVISMVKRSESEELQMNGTYLITATDLSQPDEIKLRVKRVDDGKEFMASFHDKTLQQEHIKLLQNAEWSRSSVYLSINANSLRGEITRATVISAQLQPAA